MDLIREARLNKNKCISRTQCGWDFSPRVYVKEEVFLETPFEAICLKCNQSSLINELEQFCEKCYQCDVYANADIVYNSIYDFDFEVLEQKQTKYLDMSTIYKIKVKEFYGLMFCGVLEEPNEWSSSPHDDYWCATFLFTKKDLCDQEYESLNVIENYLKY
jgi:hypothetical protein